MNTNLHSFLSHFSSRDGKLVNTINPLATFEVIFSFQPTVSSAGDTGIVAKLGTDLSPLPYQSQQQQQSSSTPSESVLDQHDSFSNIGKHTFMEYLAKANLLINNDNQNEASRLVPLELSLGYYVQAITVPQLKILGDTKSANTILGEFPINGTSVQPETTTLQMDIINTKLPLIERIFYPWMREVTLPWWSYESQPYTTATITIDFSKNFDIQYVFYGCRPSVMQMMQPLQEPNAPITRQITFNFDFMFITSRTLPVVQPTVESMMENGNTWTNSNTMIA